MFTWLFLSGIDKVTTCVEVEEYLKNKNITSSSCEKMTTKKSHIFSSFKLGIPEEDKERVLTASFWPKGTIVNYFSNLKKIVS